MQQLIVPGFDPQSSRSSGVLVEGIESFEDLVEESAHLLVARGSLLLEGRVAPVLVGGDEQRGHGSHQERQERDAQDDHQHANHSAPGAVRHDVAVADGAERDDCPPDTIPNRGEVPLIDEPDEYPDADSQPGGDENQVREDPPAGYEALNAIAKPQV